MDWKISEVIARYPQLVDELVSLNPTFRLLKNPVARRVQSRLVTVAQAARIGGMAPEGLLDRLNAAIGATAEAAPPDDACVPEQLEHAPVWTTEAPVVADVDVRDLQRGGEEPFGRIMAAARLTSAGQMLRLRSSFEPVPLYTVMAQRGFDRWTERHEDDDWEVLFLNAGRPTGKISAPAPQPADTIAASWTTPTARVTIDVSDLVPPEPLIRIMGALEDLPPGGSLLVHHVRRPIYLYPQLDEAGYRHQTRDLGPGKVELLIEKPAVER